MKTTELVKLIMNLPANEKKVVEDLIVRLVSEEQANVVKKPRKFGELKGLLGDIGNDFNL